MKSSGGLAKDHVEQSMIMEGFICPECQQDMTNIELLQAHFELFHSKKNNKKSSDGPDSSNKSSGFSSVLAKAKNFITFDEGDSASSPSAINDSQSATSQTSAQPQSTLSLSSANSSQAQLSANVTGSNSVSTRFLKEYFNANQNDGTHLSLTSEFKKYRDNSIGRYVIQTNKLLITLDKLISIDQDLLYDDSKRESHFKSIVSWIPDADVQLCPNCAKSFNLINRKHHCRLCGAIMCNKCSQFISFYLAKQLTDPDEMVKAHSVGNVINVNKLNGDVDFKLKRSDSLTSLNSFIFKSNNTSANSANKTPNKNNNNAPNLNEIFLRLCLNCGSLLEKKYKYLKDKCLKPDFVNYYEELSTCINEINRNIPIYDKMSESLNMGETTYQLSQAEDARHKLIKLFKRLETISSSILNYQIGGGGGSDSAADSMPMKISNDQLKLQRQIRYYAISFLRENSLNMAQIPNAEEYEKLKSQRQLYVNEELKRSELERRRQTQQINDKMAKVKFNRKKENISIDNANGYIPSINANQFLEDQSDPDGDDQSTNSSYQDANGKSSGPGAGATPNSPDEDKKNALRIQIQLVEAYLDDALKKNKKSEADILRKNLNELLTSLANLN